MSYAKDINEREADAAGLLLMDLLYGEIDGEAADQARQRLRQGHTELDGATDDGLDQELAAFSSLRSMLRDLPEEEPPAQLTAKLMHAAAAQAPQAAAMGAGAAGEQPGLWTWLKGLLQPITMYPGLAAATSLVLMVGVAGTLYMTGRWDAADVRRARTAATSPAGASAPAYVAPAEGLVDRAPEAAPQTPAAADGDMAEEAVQAEPAAVGGLSGAESGRAEAPSERQAKDAVRERSSDKKSRKASRASAGQAVDSAGRGDSLDALLSDSVGRQSASSAGSASGGATATRPAAMTKGKASDSVPAAPPPTSPAETMPMQPAPAASAPQADGSAASRLRAMHDDARASAAKGDCDAVTQIGTSIRRLDERYYTSSFRTDSKLAACLGQKQ